MYIFLILKIFNFSEWCFVCSFLMYSSSTSFIKFIPKYFMLLDIIFAF